MKPTPIPEDEPEFFAQAVETEMMFYQDKQTATQEMQDIKKVGWYPLFYLSTGLIISLITKQLAYLVFCSVLAILSFVGVKAIAYLSQKPLQRIVDASQSVFDS
jgi:uncharacterized membrane protein YukC